MKYNIGDIVRTKKVHPCGSKLWKITRVGVDYKMECQGCRTCNSIRKIKSRKNNNKNRTKKRRINFAFFNFF